MRLLSFVFGAVVLAGCGGAGDTSSAPVVPSADTASYSFRVIADSSACDDKKERCLHVYIRWPEFAGSAAADSVNTWIRSQAATDDTGAVAASVEEYVESIKRDFYSFAVDVPDAPGGWSEEQVFEVGRNTSRVVTVRYTVYTYRGGAHPNGFVRWVHFDASTGRQIELPSLLRNEAAYVNCLRDSLRRRLGVAPGQTLESGGAFVQGDSLPLPSTFTVEGDTLVAYYNPYEILSYAEGPVEIKIPVGNILSAVDTAAIKKFTLR